jgi:hypothetical protein
MGATVTVNKQRKAPTREEAYKFRDIGDLIINGNRSEAKNVSVLFTGPDDWPYTPHFMVCSVSSFDGAKEKPKCFFYVSGDWTHLAQIVVAKSQHLWKKAFRYDHRFHEEQENYFCPMNLIAWKKVPEHITARFAHMIAARPPAPSDGATASSPAPTAATGLNASSGASPGAARSANAGRCTPTEASPLPPTKELDNGQQAG